LNIESRSAFFAIVGNTDFGHFICLPDWGIGSRLAVPSVSSAAVFISGAAQNGWIFFNGIQELKRS